MDAPPIEYARTADGVNIAYWTLGEGPPLLVLSATGEFSTRAWFRFPPTARIIEDLGTAFQVVGLDPRDHGASDHGIDRLSPDDFALDIEAVLDALALRRVALFAKTWSAPVAVRYAVLHPDHVSHLVLQTPILRGADADTPLREALHEMDRLDQAVTSSAMATALGLASVPQAEFAEFRATLLDNPDRDRLVEARRSFDASPDLASVQAPALVIQYPQQTYYRDDSRAAAAGLPKARLIEIEDITVAPVAVIADFIESTNERIEPHEVQPGFRTLLFTDLESSTALTQSLGDAKAQEILRGHNGAVRTALAAHDGEEVKHTGDGIFAAFGSAVSAVGAALQIQRDLAGGEVRVRIGLNAGEPIQEDDDYFGTAVQLAARVCDRAEPGQVLVSRVVMDLCAGKGFQFEDQGETTLKGFPEPVRLFVAGEARE